MKLGLEGGIRLELAAVLGLEQELGLELKWGLGLG